MADLTRWLAGDGTPSIGVFLRVVDVLIAERDKPKLNPMEKPKQRPAKGG
jgi:hypothetical protein